jgi:aerobic-type carbon monoxide dehydrogenase small subunit (CoxS/CutS family)
MATENDLFDNEPEKSDKPAGRQASEQQQPPAGHGGVTRRRFLVGAGTAAVAGAAVGSGITAGINALGGDSEKSATSATVAQADGMTLGVPDGQPVTQSVVKLNVNGKDEWVSVAPQQSLAEVLRENLGLTGTKIGCDRSECGACTVLLDDVPHNSCSLLAIREGGKKIITIEGLERSGKLSLVQQAFLDNMALQCGFCTPGMILQATALLKRNPKPNEAEIRREMAGNLCKCSAYPHILAAVQAASKATAG